MNMLDKLRSRLGGHKSAGGIFALGRAQAMGNSFEAQVSDGYEANGWVMRCIRQRVEAISSVPLVLYADRTKEKEIENHPLLDLLANPNPENSWLDIVEDLVGFRLLNGNSYLYAPPTSTRNVREIYCLNAGACRPNIMSGQLRYYDYWTEQGAQQFAPEDMLHWMCWNPRSPYLGLSPLQSAALSVVQNNEAKRWNAAVLQNGGRTWGTFATDKNLTTEQYNRLKELMEKKYTGPEHAGKPMLLEGGLHWEQMGLTSQDIDWLAGMKLSMREICTVYATPSQLLGDSEASTYANYKEANKAFWRGTVVPDLAQLMDQLNRFLIPRYDKSRRMLLAPNLDGIEALAEDRTELWNRVKAADWLTVNEKRQATGYETIVGGDVILLPMSSVPQNINEPFEDEEEVMQQPPAMGQQAPVNEQQQEDDLEAEPDADE